MKNLFKDKNYEKYLEFCKEKDLQPTNYKSLELFICETTKQLKGG